MKTFRFSLVALVATALFTACSNEVVEQQQQPTISGAQAITFRLQGGTPEIVTRATATTVLNVDAFVVYGTDNAATTNIFDGVTVARQAGSSTFDYNPKKYFSLTAASATFIAYSPVSANITSFTATDPLITASFDYEVKAPDATGITSQEDLLVADTLLATIASTTTVNLTFEHALSRIFVKAANHLDETVVIKGLTLKNLKSEGTMDYNNPSWDWSGQATPIDYDYVLAQSGVAVQIGGDTTLVTSMEQGMMVLPQETVNILPLADFDSGDFALEVTYDVANLTGEKAHILLDDGFEFEKGKQYVILIEFDGTNTGLIEIGFTIAVSDFETPIEEVLYP